MHRVCTERSLAWGEARRRLQWEAPGSPTGGAGAASCACVAPAGLRYSGVRGHFATRVAYETHTKRQNARRCVRRAFSVILVSVGVPLVGPVGLEPTTR